MKKTTSLYDYFDRTSIILATAYFAFNAIVFWAVILTSFHDISVTDPTSRVFFKYNAFDRIQTYSDILEVPSVAKINQLTGFVKSLQDNTYTFQGLGTSLLELLQSTDGAISVPDLILRRLQKFEPSQQVLDLHNRPRVDPLTQKQAPNEMTPSLPYIMGLLGLVIFPLILAVLAPISLCCFCILRCCCGCCGGWSADSSGYDETQIKKTRLALGAISLTILGASIAGLSGNGAFRTGIEQVFDSVAKVAKSVVADVADIVSGVEGLTNFPILNTYNLSLPNDTTSLGPLQSFSDSITATANSFKATVLGVDDYRASFITTAFAFTIGLGAIGTFCAVTMMAGLPLLVSALAAWLGSTFVWISYVIHYPLAVLAADVCVTFSTISQNAVNNPTMNFFLPCSGAIAATFASLDASLAIFQDNCTTAAAAAGPPDDADILAARDSLGKSRAALARLGGCAFISDLVEALHDSICITMLGGFITIADSFGIIGAMFVMFSPACLIAMKRFKSSNKSAETVIAGMGGDVDTEMEPLDEKSPEANSNTGTPVIDPETGMVIS